ncbi:MAG: methyltransferase domain-containing protein [Pseudomonadota bacterium]
MSTKPGPTTESVVGAYRRWAPIYDRVFGKIFDAGRRRAVDAINRRGGRLLEVGVGTGFNLPLYDDAISVTGIDLSPDMLAVARKRVAEEGLSNVDELLQMDASRLAFPDASFDMVAAMYVITVVPDPAAVLAEMVRVAKPGADIYVINHFAAEGDGPRALVERQVAKLGDRLGWQADFEKARVAHPGMTLIEDASLPPLNLFSLLRFRKPEIDQAK